jgi:amidase
MEAGRLKIGVLAGVPGGWHVNTELHPDCADAVKDAAQLCGSLGHIVEEIAPDQLSYPNVTEIFGCIFSCFIGHAVAYWERELGKKIAEDELDPLTWGRYQSAKGLTGANYLVAMQEAQDFTRKVARQWTPENPEKWIALVQSFGTFTRIQNLTGQPAMSVPLFWNRDGIPIGVQFAGRFGDEATLFRLATQLEQKRPWAHRKPLIHCSKKS